MKASFFKDMRGNNDCSLFGKKSNDQVTETTPVANSQETKPVIETENNSISGSEFDDDLDDGDSANTKGAPTRKMTSLQAGSHEEEEIKQQREPERAKLFTPRLFRSHEYHTKGNPRDMTNIKRRKERTQTYTPDNTSENVLGASFSELIGQLEAANQNYEKEQEIMKNKLKKYEKMVLQKEFEIQKLSKINTELNLKATEISGSFTNLHAELACLKEEKDKIDIICQKHAEEILHYKENSTELAGTAETLKNRIKSIKSQIQAQGKVKEAELVQRALQIDQLSGMLSEEKLKSSDLLKKVTSRSEWEASMSTMQSELTCSTETGISQLSSTVQKNADESKELLGSIKELIGDKNGYLIDSLKRVFLEGWQSESSSLRNSMHNDYQNANLNLISQIREMSSDTKQRMEQHFGDFKTQVLMETQESISCINKWLTDTNLLKENYNSKVDQFHQRNKELEQYLNSQTAEISRERDEHKKECLEHMEELNMSKLALQKNEVIVDSLKEKLKEKSMALEVQTTLVESLKIRLLENEKTNLSGVCKLQGALEEKENQCVILKDKAIQLEKDLFDLRITCHEMKETITVKERKIEGLETERNKLCEELNESRKQVMIMENTIEIKGKDISNMAMKLKDLKEEHQKSMETVRSNFQMEYNKSQKLEQENRELIMNSKLKEKEVEYGNQVLENQYKEKIQLLECSVDSEQEANRTTSALLNKMDIIKKELIDKLSTFSSISNSKSIIPLNDKESQDVKARQTGTSITNPTDYDASSHKTRNIQPKLRNKKKITLTGSGSGRGSGSGSGSRQEDDVFSLERITSSPPNKKARKK